MIDVSRRGLLGFIAMAPFIVKASSLMPIFVPKQTFIVRHFKIIGVDQFGEPLEETIRYLGGGSHSLCLFKEVTDVIMTS